jgi:hypothetical protein
MGCQDKDEVMRESRFVNETIAQLRQFPMESASFARSPLRLFVKYNDTQDCPESAQW